VIAVASNESQLLLTLYSNLSALIDAASSNHRHTAYGAIRNLPQRCRQLPESGLDGYQVELLVGVFARRENTRRDGCSAGREIVRIVNLPEVKSRFVTSGYEVVASTPEQFSERVRRDTEMYRKIILESGMQQL